MAWIGLLNTSGETTHYIALRIQELRIYGTYTVGQGMNEFPELKKTEIIEILNYVDSFPYNAELYKHRKLTEFQRQKYIMQVEAQYTKIEDITGQPSQTKAKKHTVGNKVKPRILKKQSPITPTLVKI